MSFRPLTGKLVLILSPFSLDTLMAVCCFRPLTGKLVLIETTKEKRAQRWNVSVPLRGSWF